MHSGNEQRGVVLSIITITTPILYTSCLHVIVIVVIDFYQFVSVWVELTDTGATAHSPTVNSACSISILY